jgi:hypothetical protein
MMIIIILIDSASSVDSHVGPVRLIREIPLRKLTLQIDINMVKDPHAGETQKGDRSHMITRLVQLERFVPSCVLLAAASGSVACDDEATVRSPDEEVYNSEPSAGASPSGAALPAEVRPVFLTSALVSTGDIDETRLVLTDTFDETTVVDVDDGMSVVGAVVPVVHGGAVFLTEGNAPVIRRFDLNDEDRLVQTGELSLAGVGVAEVASWYVHVESDTKGYVFDVGGSRLIVWDPSTMVVTGAQIDLSSAAREGFVPNLVLELMGPRRRGSNLFIPLSWFDQDFNYRHASGFVVIDTATDQLVTVAEDERCGEAYSSVQAPNGDLYFFPSADSSAQHFFAEGFQPTCVLRVASDALDFDPGEPLDLSALGSGQAASGVVPDGATGFFFSTVDEALWQARENESEAYWRLWHYDFATGVSRPLEGLPVWAGTTYYVDVGGTPYLPHWTTSDAGDHTTLYRLNGSEDPTPLFSFDASWYGFNRLR